MAEEEIKKEASQEAAEDTKETKAEEAKAEETKAEEAKTEEPSKKSKKEKPSKTDKEKEALKEQVSVLEDKVKRQLAEFENFRNRTEKEKTASYDNGAANALKKFLFAIEFNANAIIPTLTVSIPPHIINCPIFIISSGTKYSNITAPPKIK